MIFATVRPLRRPSNQTDFGRESVFISNYRPRITSPFIVITQPKGDTLLIFIRSRQRVNGKSNTCKLVVVDRTIVTATDSQCAPVTRTTAPYRRTANQSARCSSVRQRYLLPLTVTDGCNVFCPSFSRITQKVTGAFSWNVGSRLCITEKLIKFWKCSGTTWMS